MKYTLFLSLCLAVLFAAGCEAAAVAVIPTERPTLAPTSTLTAQLIRNDAATATASASPTRASVTVTRGASPTPLFGATRTPSSDEPTAVRVLNPNAPSVEFFRAGFDAIAPGDSLTLYWATRNTENAVIYQLNANGQRSRTWNVPSDGRLDVDTSTTDRGAIEFVLIAGEDTQQFEEYLSIALACPIEWFFQPPPEACPSSEYTETQITEQTFERGRMIYVASLNEVFVLFNDDRPDVKWVRFPNLYDPAIHPLRDEAFEQSLPPGFEQPTGIMGFVWRGNDQVRQRLGLGITLEITFDGFVQSAPARGETGSESLYISSSNGTIGQLLPRGESWQIITPS